MLRTTAVPVQIARGVADGLDPAPRSPGSSTPGGNGVVRDAMNAPTPAHAASTTSQISTLRPRLTPRSVVRAGQPRSSPVISARNDKPKQMNEPSEKGTHAWSWREPGRARWLSLATTCATTRTASGPKPYT